MCDLRHVLIFHLVKKIHYIDLSDDSWTYFIYRLIDRDGIFSKKACKMTVMWSISIFDRLCLHN